MIENLHSQQSQCLAENRILVALRSAPIEEVLTKSPRVKPCAVADKKEPSVAGMLQELGVKSGCSRSLPSVEIFDLV
jgi:hypothetical protein